MQYALIVHLVYDLEMQYVILYKQTPNLVCHIIRTNPKLSIPYYMSKPQIEDHVKNPDEFGHPSNEPPCPDKAKGKEAMSTINVTTTKASGSNHGNIQRASIRPKLSFEDLYSIFIIIIWFKFSYFCSFDGHEKCIF